ncbi:TadE/TadG family type IV pilus assembly protein [Streptomyces sp. NPDC088400]|uniref:TadE/TadG family type IV pilus assembly protein n=1 Tax=Streptomyces sp. NPDC088400 TaxID=3365861 RepID=UPI003822D5EF
MSDPGTGAGYGDGDREGEGGRGTAGGVRTRAGELWVRRLRATGLWVRRPWPGRLRAWRLRDDRGQVAVEFTGMLPVILATAVLLWQATLIGYTFSLAGNAADEAVRAAAVADGDRNAACTQAAEEHLPGAWSLGDVSCPADGDLVDADIGINIPVLFPGFDIPVDITAHASAVKESD